MANYALCLACDFSQSNGRFQPYTSSPPGGRYWINLDTGQVLGNPDTYHPTLSAANDQVQFWVQDVSNQAQPTDIVVTVGPLMTDNPNTTNASPFSYSGGSARCMLDKNVLSTENQGLHYAGNQWWAIGPYSLRLPQGAQGPFKYEMNIVAQLADGSGNQREFGYDPEMDVEN
jgi:hypothetical protein